MRSHRKFLAKHLNEGWLKEKSGEAMLSVVRKEVLLLL